MTTGRNMKSVKALAAGSLFLVSACSFGDDLWPPLPEGHPAGSDQPAQSAQRPPAELASGDAQTSTSAGRQPALGASNFEPQGVTSGPATGTFVGKKIEQLREELRKLETNIRSRNDQLQALRGRIIDNSQQYHGTVAAVESRLQVGTTPGNPVLVQQFNTAQQDLDRIGEDVGELNKLSTSISADSTLAAFLTESVVAAFQVSGSVDEDHRQLAILEDEVDQMVILIARLHGEVTEDVKRQSTWVGFERTNLELLSSGIRSGESLGSSLINRAVTGQGAAAQIAPPALSNVGRTPLVVIRFDKPNVPFQQALYNAVSKTLERRPQARFDLVAVAPSAGDAGRQAINANRAKRHRDSVYRSLIELGLPPARIAQSATSAATATTNEVHLYIR